MNTSYSSSSSSSSTASSSSSPILLVQGMDAKTIEQSDLETHFSSFGDLDSCSLKTPPTGGDFTSKYQKAYALIKFKTKEGYLKALSTPSHIVKSQTLTVSEQSASSSSNSNSYLKYQGSMYVKNK